MVSLQRSEPLTVQASTVSPARQAECCIGLMAVGKARRGGAGAWDQEMEALGVSPATLLHLTLNQPLNFSVDWF